jgi:arylsulfatase
MSVDRDELTYVHNHSAEMTELALGAVTAGRQRIVLDVTALEGGTHVDVRVLVRGQVRGKADALPMPMGMAMFQGIDVGVDRGSPVSWARFDAEGTFPYTGTLHSVTWTPGDPAPGTGPETLAKLREIGMAFE